MSDTKPYSATICGDTLYFDTGREVHIAYCLRRYVASMTRGSYYEYVALVNDVINCYNEEIRLYYKHINRTLFVNIYRLCIYVFERGQNENVFTISPRDLLLDFLDSGYNHSPREETQQ